MGPYKIFQNNGQFFLLKEGEDFKIKNAGIVVDDAFFCYLTESDFNALDRLVAIGCIGGVAPAIFPICLTEPSGDYTYRMDDYFASTVFAGPYLSCDENTCLNYVESLESCTCLIISGNIYEKSEYPDPNSACAIQCDLQVSECLISDLGDFWDIECYGCNE